MKNSSRRKGFTIIEMVIVIAIIGILAAVLIPTYGNVVGSSNESGARQSCLSAYKELYSATLAKKGQYIRNGYVFLSGKYAYANMDGGIQPLNYMGELSRDDVNPDDWLFFLLGTVSSTQSGVDTDAVYAIPDGTYSVYTLQRKEVEGTYLFLVYKEGAHEEEMTVPLGSEYKQQVRCVNAAYKLYAGAVPTMEQLMNIADTLLLIEQNGGGDDMITVSCDSFTSLTVSAAEGKTVNGYQLTTGEDGNIVSAGIASGGLLTLAAAELAAKCTGVLDTLTISVE